MTSVRFAALAACLLLGLARTLAAAEPILRKVPPIGIEIPPLIRSETDRRLAALRRKFKPVADQPGAADVDVFFKAVELALEQREIYDRSQLALFAEMLTLAEKRLAQLAAGDVSWHFDELTVRGFYSSIDDSPQPYGLVIPKDLPKEQSVPLYVWLHGRGDKTTDIHFISQRLTRVGRISPPNAIVLHPFGRQCIGYKSAGETDVLEAIQHVKANYNVDPDRVVLMGFSMGGAGAWHLGAHYTDQFLAVSPGAGFAETAEYQKLTPDQIANVPSYERTLWGLYDVPRYVRNLFNVPIVCYSGEKDRQIQAARVMEAAFQQNGRTLDHVIGPGMGHDYHPDALAEIMSKMDVAVKREKTPVRYEMHLQTQTLRYSKMYWIHVDRLVEHWRDSTVDVRLKDGDSLISTRNVAQLTLDPLPSNVRQIIVDGHAIEFTPDANNSTVTLSRKNSWRLGPLSNNTKLAKKRGLQGPIDDAFLERFIVVPPTRPSGNKLFDEWVEFELNHLRERWSTLFRGTLPEKRSAELSQADIQDAHLIVFGTPESNPTLREAIKELPVVWEDGLRLGQAVFSGSQFVPVLIYPNPLNPEKYMVLNSGPTFRESHDRTNSLQNPKLPDWAILDITTPSDGESAGRVVQAGFFDEHWNLKRKPR